LAGRFRRGGGGGCDGGGVVVDAIMARIIPTIRSFLCIRGGIALVEEIFGGWWMVKMEVS
jgi:hypothetical protein